MAQLPKVVVTFRLDGAALGELELLLNTVVKGVAVPQILMCALLKSTLVGTPGPATFGRAASYIGFDTQGKDVGVIAVHKTLPGVLSRASVMVMVPSTPLMSCSTTASTLNSQEMGGGKVVIVTVPVSVTGASCTGLGVLDES
tara:strand:- start:752 stop:1180 length:429 start_codon:yes stop_codon:yes gene_type:complete